jgi:O-antigen/teichoic acid export membrane protein
MLLTMAVSLYTSRVVLDALGVEDYGIYSVVAGFVAMLGFLNNAMASGTQRFLSFEIGRKDQLRLSRVFLMSINIHFLIGFIVILLAETIGVWVLNTQLSIPPDRMIAANWVFHFSVLTFFVGVVSVPYNAAIIAHERMAVFAWVSIVEVFLKLFIVFALQWFGYDKLMMYAILTFVVSLVIRLLYGFYCNKNFVECKFKWFWDNSLFKTLVSYAGWNLWGNAAGVLSGQGVNIMLNIFFGPTVNAARGIADQIRGAVNGFVLNFQMAINPQIIKSYANDDLQYMHQLIFMGAKFSFFLLYLISLPVLFETEFLLNAWLVVVPEYTVVFTRLVIVNILVDSISGPLMTAAQASGKIKRYQSIVGGLLLFIVPVSYLLLKIGYDPEITLVVSISISILALFVRLIIISPLVSLSISKYVKNVILRILPTVFLSLIPPLVIQNQLSFDWIRLVLMSTISISSALLAIYFVALNPKEKQLFKSYFYQVSVKLKS